MLLKFGVKFDSFKPQIWFALGFAELVSLTCTYGPLTVSCGTEGVHKDARNIHGNGYAVDIRTHGLTDEQKTLLFDTLRAKLDPLGFDTVFEDKGTENEHIHIEWDPKDDEQLYRWVD